MIRKEFRKIECFVILTNFAPISQECSPLIMRFFDRIHFEDFLRKTTFFHFCRAINSYIKGVSYDFKIPNS